MKLLTKQIQNTLLANGAKQDPVRGTKNEIDFCPVVKLFAPDGAATWLLTELDPEEPDIAFGLCDLGVQCPEIGSVRISEIESIRGTIGLPVERDKWFVANWPLSVYAEASRSAGAITDNEKALAQAAAALKRRTGG